eukprot:4161955-Ditylum_brightwellii.AAC.1
MVVRLLVVRSFVAPMKLSTNTSKAFCLVLMLVVGWCCPPPVMGCVCPLMLGACSVQTCGVQAVLYLSL